MPVVAVDHHEAPSPMWRASSNVLTPAARALLANVWRRAYGDGERRASEMLYELSYVGEAG